MYHTQATFNFMWDGKPQQLTLSNSSADDIWLEIALAHPGAQLSYYKVIRSNHPHDSQIIGQVMGAAR